MIRLNCNVAISCFINVFGFQEEYLGLCLPRGAHTEDSGWSTILLRPTRYIIMGFTNFFVKIRRKVRAKNNFVDFYRILSVGETDTE